MIKPKTHYISFDLSRSLSRFLANKLIKLKYSIILKTRFDPMILKILTLFSSRFLCIIGALAKILLMEQLLIYINLLVLII